ncbi:carbon-nitrogen family hydrolase [Lachnospiraceae bacterium ZAX-1]
MKQNGEKMKIALSQTEIRWEEKQYNLVKAEGFIKDASQKKADMILFPEMSFTGFSMHVSVTQDTANETLDHIKHMAIKYKIGIGFGWVKKNHEDAENHYTIVDDLGEASSDYIKIHSFSYAGEDKYFKHGDKISLFKIKDVWMSTFICYDLRFPEIFQAASDKASILIVPANWPAARKEHWRCLLRARAIENQCYIIGVNCVGRQGKADYAGNSCVINPVGETIYEMADKEELYICEIKNDVFEYRAGFPAKKDRMVELYKQLEHNLDNI